MPAHLSARASKHFRHVPPGVVPDRRKSVPLTAPEVVALIVRLRPGVALATTRCAGPVERGASGGEVSGRRNVSWAAGSWLPAGGARCLITRRRVPIGDRRDT